MHVSDPGTEPNFTQTEICSQTITTAKAMLQQRCSPVEGKTPQHETQLYYSIDYLSNQLLYLYSPTGAAFGYSTAFLQAAGPQHLQTLMHPDDAKVFRTLIYPHILRWLRQQEEGNDVNFLFSYTYRVRTGDGLYRAVCQRATYQLHTNGVHPIAAWGYLLDISDFKEDTSMIFTIEQLHRREHVLHKSVYMPSPVHEPLTRREQQVLQLAAAGASSKQIAERLCVSINTVNNHRKNMLSKTGSKNFVQLLRCATGNRVGG